MTGLILFAVLAIGVSFLCSVLEAGLLSLPRSRVEAMVQQGSRAGQTLQAMKNDIDRPLAAILTLNTVAHTIGAAGVGAQAAVLFGDRALGIVSAVMTLAILVLSEIIPKTLGALHANRMASFLAISIRVMMFLCYPLIIVLEKINRLIGAKGHHKEQTTRSEILATLRLGREGGALGPREHKVVQNVLALAKIKVEQILTPRTVIFAFPHDMTISEIVSKHRPIRYSRIPVYKESMDDVIGYVLRQNILKTYTDEKGEEPVASLVQPLTAIPETASVSTTLDEMLQKHDHIAQVIDEYGGLTGIVTLEDCLETLLGQEIVDEYDEVADMQELARRKAARK